MSAAHPLLSTLPSLAHARVVGGYAQTAVDTARELGADLQRLARESGIPEVGSLLPESMPVQRYIALLDAAARQLDEPCFGLRVGQHMRLSTFAGYGLVICTSRNFREAAEQTRRFEGLAHDLGRSELEEFDGLASYRWWSPWLGEPGARHLSESVMAGIQTFANWLAGTQLPVFDVAFVHALPANVPLEEYQRVFGTNVRFNAPVTEARFPAAVLDAPVPNADPSLHPRLAQMAEQLMRDRQRETRETSIVQAVRSCIEGQLMHDQARLPDVARALGHTERTLQRKLYQAGESFSSVLDGTRRELAERYLADSALTLTEIAFLLGFGEQSNFSHAFRAWFGTTPAAWREARQRHR